MSNIEVVFDAKGRLEPDATIKSPAHLKSRNYFKFPNLEFDLSASYKRISAVFDIPIAEDDFVTEVEGLLKESRVSLGLDETKNVLAIPFFTPTLGDCDLGEILDNTLIPAVGKSYQNIFPDYQFKNEFPHSLSGHLKSIPGLGHDRLERAVATGPVVGLCLCVLREYSVHAAREQAKIIGGNFGLAGAIDLSSVFVSQPDLLFHKNEYPPLMWMSGCQTSWDHANFHYEAYGYNLMFNRRVHYDQVAEYWAHGVTCFKSI